MMRGWTMVRRAPLLGAVLAVPTFALMALLSLCPCVWAWRWLSGSGAKASLPGPASKTLRACRARPCEITIAGDLAGFVIGRRGRRVRQLEEESGARIRFRDLEGSEDKVVVITGEPESVRAAEAAVQSLVAAQERERREAEVVSLSLPCYAVGRIIGRQGTNIRSLERETGAHIVVAHGNSAVDGGGARECRVSGGPEQISRAVALLREAVLQSDVARGRRAVRHRSPPQALEQPLCGGTLRSSVLAGGRDFFPAFVSVVDGAGGVWVQRVEGGLSAELDLLVADMTQHFSQLPLQDSCPGDIAVDTAVAAPFEHDDSWYRAKVVAMDTVQGTAELLYVDFGDGATVALSSLKQLRAVDCELPTQATCCRLAGVRPSGGGVWTDEALRHLERLTMCTSWRVVMVMVDGWAVEGGGCTPLVRIIDTTTDKDVDVAEELVAAGHCEWWRGVACGEGGRQSPEGSGSSTVQLHLNMQDVHVAGTFSEWQPQEMRSVSPGLYQCSLSLPEGSHQYKFIVDGQWRHDASQPVTDDTFGGLNNYLDVDHCKAA